MTDSQFWEGVRPTGTPGSRITRVRVVSVNGTHPCAGRVFRQQEPVEFDASPGDVTDLLKAPPALQVTWPKDFTLPDGSQPHRAASSDLMDAAAADAKSPAERVRIIEEAARKANERADLLAHQLVVADREHDNTKRSLAAAEKRIVDLAVAVQETERRAAQSFSALEAEKTAHTRSVDAHKAQARAAADSAKSDHLAEVEKLHVTIDRLEREAEALKADLAAATKPTPAPAPAPEPKPAAKPGAPKNGSASAAANAG